MNKNSCKTMQNSRNSLQLYKTCTTLHTTLYKLNKHMQTLTQTVAFCGNLTQNYTQLYTTLQNKTRQNFFKTKAIRIFCKLYKILQDITKHCNTLQKKLKHIYKLYST
jgi:RNA processing factor Prp31